MEKSKLLQVIAAIMITSMAVSMLSFSTTTVTAYTGQATVGLTPLNVRDNAAVLFTLTITNPSALNGGDNIENIVIVDTNNGFTTAYGGNENVADNWDNIADNLIIIADNMVFVRDNLLLAVGYIKAAGVAMMTFGNYENIVGTYLAQFVENDNVMNAGLSLQDAAPYWQAAGTKLQSEPFVFGQVAENLRLASTKTSIAGQWLYKFTSVVKSDVIFHNTGENLRNSAYWLDNHVKDNLDNTCIGWADNGFDDMRIMWENAGIMLGSYGTTYPRSTSMLAAANYMENYAAKAMTGVTENFRRAMWALENAGTLLSNIENQHYDNADLMLASYARDLGDTGVGFIATSDNLLAVNAGLNIENAGLNLDRTGLNGIENYDNILRAGENLKAAAAAFDVANWIGPNFASDILGWQGETSTTSARYYIERAGENMDNENCIDLTTAANNLYSAGQRLKDAGNKLKATKALLSPTTGWGLIQGTMGSYNGVQITPIRCKENELTAGNTLTVSFFWMAPDISTENQYRFRVYTYGRSGGVENVASDNIDFLVTVDGKAPYKISSSVQQTGVAVANVAGRNYDNGKFTFSVTASKALSALGQVYIENRTPITGTTTLENVVAPFTLTSTDNITWSAIVSTTSWLDNWDNLRVRIAAPWATDSNGLENADSVIENFIFDTHAPIIIDNGLGVAGTDAVGTKLGVLTQEVKPGTTTTYFRTSKSTWSITGRAEDNWPSTDNATPAWVTVTIVVDSTVSATSPLLGDNFGASVTIVDGAHAVKVRATDRVGNVTENILENVYVDNTPPTVTFMTVNGVTWTDNTLKVNDNTVDIVVKIHDAGWGIVRNADGAIVAPKDNVWVYLDNDGILSNGENILLENLGVWDNGAVGTFENKYDNYVGITAMGLDSGYWYVVVVVGDNVQTQAIAGSSRVENENHIQRFFIDVTVPTWTQTQLQAVTTVKDSVTSAALGATTKKTSWLIAGGARKAGSTIKVYAGSVLAGQATASTTANVGTGLYDYSLTIVLSEGAGQNVYIEEIDTASNTSGQVLLGTYTVDKTPPVIALSAPAAGTTTDAQQITVSGTILDAMVTDPQILLVTIDCTGASVAKPVYPDVNGSFETTVPLVEGANVINVVAADGAVTATSGNQAITTRTVTRTVTPLTTYAIILVVVALILAAIAIFRKEIKK